MTRRATTHAPVAVLVFASALAGTACLDRTEQASEAHAADTRAQDDQADRIRAKDEKSGPKDTTVVVGRDSVKVDGG
jgi:hypothetical protein